MVSGLDVGTVRTLAFPLGEAGALQILAKRLRIHLRFQSLYKLSCQEWPVIWLCLRTIGFIEERKNPPNISQGHSEK